MAVVTARAHATTSHTARPRRGVRRASERVEREQRERDLLWSRYRAKPDDPSSREQLLISYTPLVRYAASRLGRMLPSHVDTDDLFSYGMMGLMGALDRFDPSAQVKFETFAMTRIRGAILDELRAMDWVPRSVRRQERAIEDTRRRLEQDLSRAPEDSEIAEALEMSEDDLHTGMQLVRRGHTVSLEESRSHGEDSSPVMDIVADDGASPESLAFDNANQEELLDAIGALPERERRVVTEYFYAGRTLAAIGAEMGVTESRVSQLRSRAIERLREMMVAEPVAA